MKNARKSLAFFLAILGSLSVAVRLTSPWPAVAAEGNCTRQQPTPAAGSLHDGWNTYLLRFCECQFGQPNEQCPLQAAYDAAVKVLASDDFGPADQQPANAVQVPDAVQAPLAVVEPSVIEAVSGPFPEEEYADLESDSGLLAPAAPVAQPVVSQPVANSIASEIEDYSTGTDIYELLESEYSASPAPVTAPAPIAPVEAANSSDVWANEDDYSGFDQSIDVVNAPVQAPVVAPAVAVPYGPAEFDEEFWTSESEAAPVASPAPVQGPATEPVVEPAPVAAPAIPLNDDEFWANDYDLLEAGTGNPPTAPAKPAEEPIAPVADYLETSHSISTVEDLSVVHLPAANLLPPHELWMNGPRITGVSPAWYAPTSAPVILFTTDLLGTGENDEFLGDLGQRFGSAFGVHAVSEVIKHLEVAYRRIALKSASSVAAAVDKLPEFTARPSSVEIR